MLPFVVLRCEPQRRAAPKLRPQTVSDACNCVCCPLAPAANLSTGANWLSSGRRRLSSLMATVFCTVPPKQWLNWSNKCERRPHPMGRVRHSPNQQRTLNWCFKYAKICAHSTRRLVFAQSPLAICQKLRGRQTHAQAHRHTYRDRDRVSEQWQTQLPTDCKQSSPRRLTD